MANYRIGVLVVDDEPVDIAVVETCLRAANYSIFTAGDYKQGLALFEVYRHQIGLLLTDISLPGKTGIHLAKSCVSMKPSLRVLFMSGWVGAEALDYVDIPKRYPYFLPKPFRSSTLVDCVRRVLESTDQIAWLDNDGKLRTGAFFSP
jgi:two-component system, cell cycle sensor histidine kinase and response regulator CckA